jgi:Uri superfamily endonuclease
MPRLRRLSRLAATAGSLPSDPGTYALILFAEHPKRCQLGRFGEQTLEHGWYLYVGSAQGSGGLRARLGHHLTPSPRPHWHIDYLKAALPIVELWFCAGPRLESDWAAALAAHPWSRVPIPGFGATDARGEEHLFHFRRCPAASCLPR